MGCGASAKTDPESKYPASNPGLVKPLEPRPEYFEFIKALPNMSGKTVAVTGCTTGCGFYCALNCAKKGATVIMLNRASSRAEDALQTVQAAVAEGARVVSIPCDMTSFASVRKAGEVLRRDFESGIDVLCNNAGISNVDDEATEDGCDIQMQVNCLSHVLLTQEVWALLEKAAEARGEARVVMHTSIEAKRSGKLKAKLMGNGGKIGGMHPNNRYQWSKLACLTWASALHDRLQKSGSKVKSLCAHPGIATTTILSKVAARGGVSGRAVRCLAVTMAQSAEDGTMGILRCCCDADVKSGELYGPPGRGMSGKAELLPANWASKNNQKARSLVWACSCETTGAKFPFDSSTASSDPQ